MSSQISGRDSDESASSTDMKGCLGCKKCNRQFLKEHGLLLANMVAIVLGLSLGFGLRPLKVSSDAIMWIGLWGELFIRMIKMLMLPLIVINLILGKCIMMPTDDDAKFFFTRFS